MATKKGKTRQAKAEAIVRNQVELIDEQLVELEAMLKPYERIKQEVDKMRAARRALLGGNRTTGEGGKQIRQQDIVEFLRENPGSAPSTIAEAMGSSQPTVSSHLYRGKNERFLTKGGCWYLRDPKAGINTVDDIEEE